MRHHPFIPMQDLRLGTSIRWLLLCILCWLFSACSFSLAQDITPPPDIPVARATPVEPVLETQPNYPLVPPDPAAGALIYAEKCEPCHGKTGLGDGPQASQLPNPVVPIGTYEIAGKTTPVRWYNVISQGNLERLMPPFGGNLSERQIWDVTAYVFTLSISVDTIDQGRNLYQTNCANCHGESGQGDGPRAMGLEISMPDFRDQAYMSERSAEEIIRAISAGSPPGMPAFEGQLTQAEQISLAAYLRDMTFYPSDERIAANSVSAPSDVQESKPALRTNGAGTVTGVVRLGSAGEFTSDLNVILHGYDELEEVFALTTSVSEGGDFTFDKVEMPVGRVFIATIEYSGATYASDVAIVETDTTSINLPITIYETTTDNSMIVADRLHLFLDFARPGVVQVMELYQISNPTDQVVIAPDEGSPVVNFALPENASNLQFQDGTLGDRYVLTQEGFGDTRSIRPGSGTYQVMFAYDLPYDRRLEIDKMNTLPVSAMVMLVPEGSVNVKSSIFQDSGVRSIQGQEYRLYSGGNLEAGKRLSLVLTGDPGGNLVARIESNTTGSLVIGLMAFSASLGLSGIWFYRRKRNARTGSAEEEDMSESSEAVESLMDAIIALDDLYKAGELPEEAYVHRRKELKAQLKNRYHD